MNETETSANGWIGFLLSFIGMGPYLLLLAWRAPREYGGPLGRLWTRLTANRIDPDGARLASFAVFLGAAAGALAAPLSGALNQIFFPEFRLALRPAEPMAMTVQIAFVQAALFEEVSKNGLGLALAMLFCAAPRTGAPGERAFLRSTPFLCAGVGLGFAFIENALYIESYMRYGAANILLQRFLISTPVHVLINLGFGLALYTARRGEVPGRAAIGLAIAILWHGVFNFFALPPVAFAQWLAVITNALLAYSVLSNLFRLMPELRYRPLAAVDASGAEELEDAQVEPARVPGGARAPVDEPVEIVGASRGVTMRDFAEDARFATLLEITPPPRAGFAMALGEDEWGRRVQPATTAPLADADYSFFDDRLRSALFADEYRGPAPRESAAKWDAAEKFWSRVILGTDQATRVWDSSCLAASEGSLGDVFEASLRAGLDLGKLTPVRVLEFDAPDRCIYMSAGLANLYGRELIAVWRHPFPAMRWFFLNLAAHAPADAPWLREFGAFLAPSSQFLGDPRGWLQSYLSLPLFDPLAEKLRNPALRLVDGTDEEISLSAQRYEPPLDESDRPLQILLVPRHEAVFLARFGWEAYFLRLKSRGAAWINDLRRPTV